MVLKSYSVCCMFSTYYTDVDGCSEERDPYFGITWPSTMVNMEATNNCPNGTGMNIQYDNKYESV